MVESGTADVSSVGDFGSYHRLLKEGKDDWARIHVVMDSRAADLYSRQVAACLREAGGAHQGASLLDVGCGPGVITEALRARLGGAALGIDISRSAVEYARSRFPRCRFEAVGLDEGTAPPQRYRVVHAREFYPFTRTGDVDTHRKYLRILLERVAPGGTLILALLDEERSLASNAAVLSYELQRRGFGPLRRSLVASDALYRFLPLAAAKPATWLLQRLRSRPLHRFFFSRP